MDAKAIDRKGDLFHACGRLDLRPSTMGEAKWLAALVRVISFGGKILITPKGHDPVDFEYVREEEVTQ